MEENSASLHILQSIAEDQRVNPTKVLSKAI
jgi:hypothetical protein